jgi:tetratricopeptide (TPR) repeat protein
MKLLPLVIPLFLALPGEAGVERAGRAEAQAAPALDTGQRAAAERWYRTGREHLRQGRYEDARDCLQEAVALNPQLIGAHKGLAKAWQGLRRPELEAQVLDRAIQLNPVPEGTDSSGRTVQTDARLWLYLDLAESLLRQGRAKCSEAALRACLAKDPGFWSASRVLAKQLQADSKVEAADRVIDAAFLRLCLPQREEGREQRRELAIEAVRVLYQELGRPQGILRFLS